MNRREFGLLSGALAGSGPAPAGVKKLKITRVQAVEVRDGTFG